jgi:hypothetical protein
MYQKSHEIVMVGAAVPEDKPCPELILAWGSWQTVNWAATL